jgi:two-component system LytT family response regulator
MTRCVLVDDEPLAIEVLEGYLQKVNDVLLLATFSDPVAAVAFLESNPVDVVFLDLNMPVLHGMEVLQRIQRKPAFIITTAYREYAVESFEWDVVDYLVKPIAFPRFLKALTKAQQTRLTNSTPADAATANNKILWLKENKTLIPVETDDILYIQSLKDYIRVITKTHRIVTYSTLQSILKKLDSGRFVQIHKSYLINIGKVKAIEGTLVRVIDDVLPIGRSFKSNLLSQVERYKNDKRHV